MSEPILEAEGLCVGYKGDDVVANVNLSFQKGRVYSIIGPNGCGKTTLMRALGRSLKPRAGRVLLRGENIFRMNTRCVARSLAVLSQSHANANDLSVQALVQYGRFAHREWWRTDRGEDRRTVEWALRTTGMADYANRTLDSLSGGERQRAWIAMSIAQKPEILLLDEPTTYLDISHQLEILELVSKLNREEGLTVLMVLHDINHAARYSDELVVVNDHRIWGEGGAWEMLQRGLLEDVFNVDALVSEDVVSGKPFVYARKVVRPS